MILEAAGFSVVGEASTGEQGVSMAKALAPDVVLMDIRMPQGSGIEATREIVEAGAGRVLIISAFDLDADVVAAIRAGAKGYVLKTIDAEELVHAVTAVAEGHSILDPVITEAVMRTIAEHRDPEPAGEWPPQELTPRETAVMECIGQGLSNRMIARTLDMAETTAKSHVSSALSKLGLASRVEAAVYVASRTRGRAGQR
ncbi:response regulator transcription factor [Arthrobacter sp. UM1]|nr:response regulator transcription factor [Arthrobacter sp. UM1]